MPELHKVSFLESQSDIRHIVEQYGDLVMTLCRKILVDKHLAEEATQDTFIKAYKNLDKFREDSSLRTWIYRIAYNTAIDYRRRRKRKVMAMDEITARVSQTDLKDGQTRLEEKEESRRVSRAISKLPADQAALINLYYLEEKKIKEVCEITGLTESNVKIRLFRARKQLAEILSKKNK